MDKIKVWSFKLLKRLNDCCDSKRSILDCKIRKHNITPQKNGYQNQFVVRLHHKAETLGSECLCLQATTLWKMIISTITDPCYRKILYDFHEKKRITFFNSDYLPLKRKILVKIMIIYEKLQKFLWSFFSFHFHSETNIDVSSFWLFKYICNMHRLLRETVSRTPPVAN